jgi:hypothetical protein
MKAPQILTLLAARGGMLAAWPDGSTAYWYAVHLMYFVPEGGTVQESVVNGCLVMSMASGSPASLAWPNYTDENPAKCHPGDGGNWSAYPPPSDEPIMNFSLADLPSGISSWYPNTTFLTEFDWAVRADRSMVAVATPEYVAAGSQPTQYGCLAVDFDLYQPYDPGQIFPTFIADIFDADASDVGDTYEELSPNACTYAPKSNTGVNIVRHLVEQNVMYPTQYQIYSIIDSGVMP